MSKNLYTFCVLSGDPAREVLRICKSNPQIHDPQVGMKMLAAAERGEWFTTNDWPADELDACIVNAFKEYPNTTVAFYREVLDPWNNTAMFLSEWIAKRWPEFENHWATFVATGVAIIEPANRLWLTLLPPPDNRAINAAARSLYPADDSARAFLHALFDWLRMCEATDAVGVVTSKCIGATQGDREFRVD